MNALAITWLQAQARAEIAGSRGAAAAGTVLYTPDCLGHYGALVRRSGGTR